MFNASHVKTEQMSVAINEHSGFMARSVESSVRFKKILWDTFRSQIAELWFPYDRRIANDRR